MIHSINFLSEHTLNHIHIWNIKPKYVILTVRDSAVVERSLLNPRAMSLNPDQGTSSSPSSVSLDKCFRQRYRPRRKELATLLHMPRLSTSVTLPALPQSSLEYGTYLYLFLCYIAHLNCSL